MSGKFTALTITAGSEPTLVWKTAFRGARSFGSRFCPWIFFLVGASMSGVAVLHAARMPEVDVSGVVSLATPQFPSKYYARVPQSEDMTPARLRQIDEPKLFVAGTKDVQRGADGDLLRAEIKRVSFAADARRMFGAAEEPKELALVDSSFHSSFLLTSAPADIRRQTGDVVLRFLSENS